MPIPIIHEDTHLDHGISREELQKLLPMMDWPTKDPEGVVKAMINTGLKRECHLIGPKTTNTKVYDHEVFWLQRGERRGKTRFCWKPAVVSPMVSLAAGPHKGQFVVYTAVTGPLAPREPWDASLQDPADKVESIRFWADHALSYEAIKYLDDATKARFETIHQQMRR